MLTPLQDEDSPALYRWINDRELVELSASFAPVAKDAHAAWFDDVRKRDDVAIFAIRMVDDGTLIGSCQLRAIDGRHRSAELQIRIGEREAWGRGLGTEAVRLLVRYAFDELALHRVQLAAIATNERALRAYEKAGFVREGVLHDAMFVGGGYRDVVVMGALNAAS